MPQVWAANDSPEAKLNRIREQVWSFFSSDEESADFGVVATFPDAVIVKDYSTESLFEIDFAEVGEEIIFGEPKAINNIYMTQKALKANPKVSTKAIRGIIDSWDDWAGGFNGCVEELSKKPGIENPEALCAWLHYQAEGKWPAQKAEGAELTGPIVFKNSAKRIAYGAILVPGEEDSDGEVLSEERVEKAAHEWMEDYRHLDLQHSLNNAGVPVESYLLPMPMTVKALDGEEMFLPKGTWIMGGKANEDVWERIESNELTGYSVMGIKRAALKSAEDSASKGSAMKKTLLRDLGEDWIAAAVSFVDRPAVPKAKFFALKSANPEPEPEDKEHGFWNKLKALANVTTSEKEGRKFSRTTLKKLKEMGDIISALVQEAEAEEQAKSQKGGGDEVNQEEVIKIVEETVESKLGPMVEEAIKAALNPEAPAEESEEVAEKEETIEAESTEETTETEETGEEETGEDEAEETEADDEDTSFKAALSEKLDTILGKHSGSRAIKGQDQGTPDESPRSEGYIERDIHGRRKKRY